MIVVARPTARQRARDPARPHRCERM